MRLAGILLIAAAAMSAAACSTYPRETTYSIYADNPPRPSADQPVYQPDEPSPGSAHESPPPATAPVGSIEGGELPPAVSTLPPAASVEPPPATAPDYNALPPSYEPPPAPPAYTPPPPATTVSTAPGARYAIQPGDTVYAVAGRFQTPVQSLIDLNSLGPQAAILPGQTLILPDSAIDGGLRDRATGPSPVGVRTPNEGVAPPPPPPPATTVAASTRFQWPVRGEILRRFGPAGVGERNNGVNIAGDQGAPVRAAAAGTVRYVGDDQPGQGLTIIMVHPDGWRTVYGHLGSASVDYGDDVRAGDQIGTVGTTAGDGRPSIHFETRQMQGGDPVAIDPVTLLPR